MTLYPAAYDDDTSLLGQVLDRASGTLKNSINVDGIRVTLEEVLAINLPAVMLFEGGELWYLPAGSVTFENNDTLITIGGTVDRGYDNTPIQPHQQGERVYFVYSTEHINAMSAAIKAMQQNGFLLGAVAQRTAYSPVAGEGWLESDTGKIYYCFVAPTWVWMNKISHLDISGVGNDDHTQYQNDARALTWHSAQAGAHIPDGDNHDHYGANEGAAVRRLDGGLLADLPAASYIGQVYFATDTPDGGRLYVSYDGVTWTSLTGVPSGAIAPFASTCPTGWTRYSALDGKHARVDSANAGLTGGAGTHDHQIQEVEQHYHPITAATGSTSSDGGHSHSFTSGGSAGSKPVSSSVANDPSNTSSSGAHTHTAAMPQHNTGSTGTSYPDTTTDNGEPPYRDTVWCKKD